MNAISILQNYRESLINSVIDSFQCGQDAQEISNQVGEFFDLLEYSLSHQDSRILEPFFLALSQKTPVYAMESQIAFLPLFVNQLFSTLTLAINREVPPGDAIELITAMQPTVDFSYQCSCDMEIKNHLNFVTNQLIVMTQSMKRIERSKSDFIAVAAHELRTPLTLIEGYVAMLEEKMRSACPDFPHPEYIKGIQNGAQRMRSTIDDMIDVSIIDNNLLRLNYQPVWIDRLIDTIVTEHKPIIQERRITLTIENIEAFRGMNYGDPERLLQLFRILLINAIKYTPDGGRISLCSFDKDHFKEILFQDTGIGIDSDDHAAIFEKFGQVGDPSLHSSGRTKFKGGGAGLGLYIARGIIEAHGGAVWVESPGRDEIKLPGSTFHILLPILDAPPDERFASMFRTISQE